MLHNNTVNASKPSVLTSKEVKANPTYWQMVEHAYSKQRSENSSVLQIKEFSMEAAPQHALKIQNGEWLALDFTDVNFVRNIFQALRLNRISQEDMIIAWSLQAAKNAFGSSISQFDFLDPAGPYHFDSISYATNVNIASFKLELSKLPEKQRVYFAIDFSKACEVSFLLELLFISKLEGTGLKPYAYDMLAKYITRSRVHESVKTTLYQALAQRNILMLIQFISHVDHDEFIKLGYPHSRDFFVSQNIIIDERENMMFLANIILLDEQLPSVQISSQYDASDPSSPLLSLILPTPSAFNALNHSMHGSDATDPFMMVGESSVLHMRELDENPEKYGRNQSMRAVEIVHCDVPRTRLSHGVYPFDFMLYWHDLWHCWRNSSNPLKPLMRHLRVMLVNTSGFELSKSIWYLTDMDVSYGRYMRNALKNGFSPIQITKKKVNFIGFLLDKIGKNFWMANMDDYSINLLLIVDMVIHAKKWSDLCSINLLPNQFLSNSFLELQTNETTKFFQHVYHFMRQLCDEDVRRKSSAYYILRYRLRHFPQSKSLCDELESFGLPKFVHWTRNSGLFLNKELKAAKGKSIDEISPARLFVKLKFALYELLLKPTFGLGFFKRSFTNNDYLKYEMSEQIRSYYAELCIDPHHKVKFDKFDALISTIVKLHNGSSPIVMLQHLDKVSQNKNVTRGFFSQSTAILLDRVRAACQAETANRPTQ